MTYREFRARLESGESTCSDMVERCLRQIESRADLNCFLEIFEERARRRAAEEDAKVRKGEFGKLSGMVIAIKDNICLKGERVSASSKILEGFESLFSATAVERLEAEGAIIIGRTNCDEFAMGSSNENSAYGEVQNPHDPSRVPGGSSGGSAAAVAAGLCHVALGSDTGGSIRQPASFCGVVGVKPTYGRVSRSGLIAYGSSFDQIGPLANNLDDAAICLEVMAGKDEKDNTSSHTEVRGYGNFRESEEKPKRIAYLKEYLESEGLDPEIKTFMLEQIQKLKDLGHVVEEVSFPYLDYMVPTYYVLTTAEASSNLARYDGVHFGYRSDQSSDLESTYIKSRSEGFGPEVKRRIMLGTFVLSSGYYDAYYSRGQKVRRLIKDRTQEIFKNYDFILTPSTPKTAFKIGDEEHAKDVTVMYLEDIFTVHANLAGNPAISIPLGNHSNGMPFGVQIMSPVFDEQGMFKAAHLMNSIND